MSLALPAPRDGRRFAAVLLLACAIVLGTALGSQYLGGLAACALCHWQRYAYGVAILALLPTFVIGPRAARIAISIAGASLLAGAGIAAFHVGVEQHWWAGTPACGGDPAAAEITTLAELRAALEEPAGPRCDEVAWSLLGISMAGYNLAASLVLAGFVAIQVRRPMGRAR